MTLNLLSSWNLNVCPSSLNLSVGSSMNLTLSSRIEKCAQCHIEGR